MSVKRGKGHAAWAITLGYSEPNGRPLYGTTDHPCRVKLFETRRQAYTFLRPLKNEERQRSDNWRGYWSRAAVTRVWISVTPI